jgi:5'-nucleotidase
MRYFDWILFDADDTLLDFVIAARQAFSAMLTRFGIPEQEHYYGLYKACNMEAWHAYETGRIDSQMLRRQRFADFQEKAGLTPGPDPYEMNRVFLEELIVHTTPLEGAMELLHNLPGRMSLGIVTNGLKEVQRPRIRHVGMEPFFKVVVVSDEIGLAKPDARFFSFAHEQMAFPPKDRVLVVGDSFSSDVMGAKNYGFSSCWYNPKAHPGLEGHQPDFEIQSLNEVLDLLE